MANRGAGDRAELSAHQAVQKSPGQHSLSILMLGALGVVYGDIGTSPIYAFREALHASSGGGVASASRCARRALADRVGADPHRHDQIRRVRAAGRQSGRGRNAVADGLARSRYPKGCASDPGIGVCGAALFFGDAIITPAISVLSAVEGLKVATPAFDPYVVPITLVILAVLFAVQRFGTGGWQLSLARSPRCGSWRSAFPA